MKRRPCCFPKPVLWELSSFRISKLLFIAIKIGIAAHNVRQNALIQSCLGFWIWMWIPYQLNLDSRFQSLAGFRVPWAQICIPKPRTSDSKKKNSLYSRVILVILHAWGGIDCKAVLFFKYSSTRKQSNKRSGTKLKRETETGERRFSLAHTLYGRVGLARFARVRLLRHALSISLLILRKNPTVLQSRGGMVTINQKISFAGVKGNAESSHSLV